MSYLKIRLHLKTDKQFSLPEIVLLRIILHGVDKKLTQKNEPKALQEGIILFWNFLDSAILIFWFFLHYLDCFSFIFNLQRGGGVIDQEKYWKSSNFCKRWFLRLYYLCIRILARKGLCRMKEMLFSIYIL